MGDRHYGLSIVWLDPSQVRAASMKEVVGKLSACTSSGTNWPYALVWLHKGTCHAPPPKEGTWHPTSERGGGNPLWADQPTWGPPALVASPQVIYPVGLNGQDEPIITSLPEPLASGVSLTTGKPIYLGIDIPSPPVEEPDQKILPLGEVSTIIVASPHTSPLKLEGSMTMEVRNLLSQAVLETSSCRYKHLSPRRPTPVAVPTTPPQKPERPPQPVDTSSQASAKVAEASLEDIPDSISPIATISRTRSITPPVDAMELQANANKALEDLLTTKASIDTHRQRAIWELGIVLCCNESQAAKSIKQAKAVCSQAILDAQTTCSWLTLETKTNCSQAILEVKSACSMAVKKAKTIRGHAVQEAKATCSKAISKVEAWRASQAESYQREHGNIMQDLEEQVIQEESRSWADLLYACQVTLYNSPPEFKNALANSYHILLGQTPLSPPLAQPQRTSPVEEQPTSAAPSTPAPKQSPRLQRWHPSPDPVESMPPGGTTPKTTLGGTPSSKRQEVPPWFRALKPSHTKAFSQDSDLVREARMEFFLKHFYNFATNGTHNLSEIFKQMAVSTDLLGTSIHEIQASWTGPNELKQANYALWSLPKGLEFFHAVPPSKSPKVMGLVGIHDPDALCCFSGITYCPWYRKEGQTRGPWSIIYGWCTTGWAWCATGAMIAHPQCLAPSTTMAGRTVANLGRTIWMSQFHLSSLQEEYNCLSWEFWQGSQDGMVYPRLPCWEYPCPPLQPWGRTSREGVTCQPTQPITYSFAKFNWTATHFQYISQSL